MSKDTADTEWAIADFIGDRKAKTAYHHTMYSDQEESIREACRDLKLKTEFSQPGMAEPHGRIERLRRDVIAGVPDPSCQSWQSSHCH